MDIALQAEPLYKDGSRSAGAQFAARLMAYLSESPDNRVVIDFSGVRTLGTGFADEAFGRLFLRLGAATFLSQLTFSNATRTVAASIDRAITMRVDSGASPEQFNNKVDS